MKTISFLLLLICFPFSLSGQNSTCAACRLNVRTGRYFCAQTCPYNGNEGCGSCCVLTPGPEGNSCYVGGCCTATGSGGICYDPNGFACGNFYKCKQGTAVVMASQQSDRMPLSSFEWTKAENLPDVVGKSSPMFGAVLREMQRQAAEDVVSITEGPEGHFYLVSRPHFGIKVAFSMLQNKWFIRTDRADPKEGTNAPSALEINGRDWKLLRHDHSSPTKMSVVATGSF
jgi:hypothetical protein